MQEYPMEHLRIVAFTGHRRIPEEHAWRLPALLEQTLEDLISKGAREFRAGGALGYDMVAALKVLELKEKHPTLPLTLQLYLPCRDQTRGWDAPSCRAYAYVLERADGVRYASEAYTSGCMLARNRHMIDGSDVCLAYCTKHRGGSFYTCTYALKKGVELINLADVLNT